jgi:hypothetical protein
MLFQSMPMRLGETGTSPSRPIWYEWPLSFLVPPKERKADEEQDSDYERQVEKFRKFEDQRNKVKVQALDQVSAVFGQPEDWTHQQKQIMMPLLGYNQTEERKSLIDRITGSKQIEVLEQKIVAHFSDSESEEEDVQN